MPGPIHPLPLRYPRDDCAIHSAHPDPASLARYGVARPHESGPMKPDPGNPFGKRRARR